MHLVITPILTLASPRPAEPDPISGTVRVASFNVLNYFSGDGQGCYNATRSQMATVLTDWLATDPTGSGDPDFLIIGDLNAYAMEDPITALEAAGYTNLVVSYIGADAYSYVYYG